MKIQPKKYLTIGILILIVTLYLFYSKPIKYAIFQGYGQVRLIYKSVEISKLLKSEELSDSLKEQLLFVQKVKKFAEDSLFLAKTHNYTTFYNAGKNEINWLVLAAYPFKLQPYTWKFFIVGKFPYLGFFNPHDAQKEAQKLKTQGFDVRIVHPTAWSTLKIFKDPVLSTMLRYSKGQLAEIIIHETTHATFYYKNQSEYNENLANFIGKQGALYFLKSEYGKKSTEYQQYLHKLEQNETQNKFFKQAAQKLDSLYTKIKKQPVKDKKIQKIKFCRKIENAYYQQFSIKQKNQDSLFYNNSFYTQFLLYNKSYEQFEQIFAQKYRNSIQKFILDLKKGKKIKLSE